MLKKNHFRVLVIFFRAKKNHFRVLVIFFRGKKNHFRFLVIFFSTKKNHFRNYHDFPKKIARKKNTSPRRTKNFTNLTQKHTKIYDRTLLLTLLRWRRSTIHRLPTDYDCYINSWFSFFSHNTNRPTLQLKFTLHQLGLLNSVCSPRFVKYCQKPIFNKTS